jgi:hypothetical protein
MHLLLERRQRAETDRNLPPVSVGITRSSRTSSAAASGRSPAFIEIARVLEFDLAAMLRRVGKVATW